MVNRPAFNGGFAAFSLNFVSSVKNNDRLLKLQYHGILISLFSYLHAIILFKIVHLSPLRSISSLNMVVNRHFWIRLKGVIKIAKLFGQIVCQLWIFSFFKIKHFLTSSCKINLYSSWRWPYFHWTPRTYH